MTDQNSPQEDGLKSRQAALKLLSGVLDKRQALDLMMQKEQDFNGLSKRDRGFVHMLVATTLRRLGQIDGLILRAMSNNTAPEPERLAHILRLGVCQILFMDVPNHAVVDTAVRLSEHQGLSRQKGLVNAVLRKLSETAQIWLSERDDPLSNIPHWLQEIWIRDYGIDEAKHIAHASLTEASIDITPKDLDMIEHWANTLDGIVLDTKSVRLNGNVHSIQNLPGFSDGMWWVQDTAASLPAKILSENIKDADVLDMCAAPGGKTAQLAAQGAHVTALDRSHNRLKILHENLKRLRLEGNVKVECADASMWQSKTQFEYVLLDAPCSATGTVRRHPDVMHIKSPDDIVRLKNIQTRLLENAYALLSENGFLLYCTCSLQKEESEYQIDAFLSKHPDMRRVPIAPDEVGGVKNLISDEGDVRALPHHMTTSGGIDGFYIARLQKQP